MNYYQKYDSSIGILYIVVDEQSVIGLFMEGQKYFFQTIQGETIEKATEITEKVSNWLDTYFLGKKPSISELPLNPQGSSFRKEVWSILCEIPYGQLYTYKDIAQIIAKKRNKSTMSAQAVGQAVGHNPISIIIPCHRVVGINGSLTGYAGGIDRKIKLLELEGVDMTKLKGVGL